MKRMTVALVLVVVGMLAIVAPASAVTLHGKWTGPGVATGTGGVWPDWGLAADPTETLGVSGNVTIAMYPMYTDVASLMIITADPGVPPFPFKINAQAVFSWGRATLTGDTYTVTGQMRSPSLLRAGLAWEVSLEADTGSHELTMRIVTTGSYWGWRTCVLHGELF